MNANQPIPENVLAAYVQRYPHLIHLAANVRLGHRQSVLGFARVACRLAAVPGVTAMEVNHLAGVAEGQAWPMEVRT